MLAGDLAGGVEGLHADVVEITAAMHGRRRVRLGEHQQLGRARLAAQMPGEHDGRRWLACPGGRAGCRGRCRRRAPARRASGRASGGSSDSRGTRNVRRASRRAARAPRWRATSAPAAARARVRWPPRGRVPASRGKSRDRACARLRARARTRRSSSRACASSRGRSISIICQDSSVHRARSSPTALSVAARIAAHRQHRVHDEMHGDVHLAEHDADRIDEEGHVRRHHAQQRAMRGGGRIGVRAAARCRRSTRLPAAPAAEFQVRERGGGQFRGTMRAQVFFGDAAEERAQEFAG